MDRNFTAWGLGTSLYSSLRRCTNPAASASGVPRFIGVTFGSFQIRECGGVNKARLNLEALRPEC